MMPYSRAFIREGDTTTAGGRVIAAPQPYPNLLGSKHATFEGDPVACPACKSTGMTRCVQPFRTNTAVDGRQRSLDGDLCICHCTTPPRLVALHHNMTMGFTAREVAAKPGCEAWLAYAGHSTSLTAFDEYFVAHDKTTGEPVSGFSYGLESSAGEYTGEVYDDGASVKAYSGTAEKIALQYMSQTTIGIRP
ncbi:MAG: PAAR domain-containing protein [Comamonadaceae bacterium]|nr:MAG: PAAR domain-containing protein [Comamonadaceae bacterium]